MLKPRALSRRSGQGGLGLIELMVGITVGLIVVAGASVLMTNQVNEHRRLMLETQVQQDLRAVADLVLRDLRRSGYWALPQNGIWAPAAAGAASNPYTFTTPQEAADAGSIVEYSYSSGKTDDEDGTRDDSTERFGFKRQDDILKFRVGNAWQPLTDPGTLIVTDFTVNLAVQEVSLADACENPCPAGAADCPPHQQVRNFTIFLRGHAKHDAAVERTVRVTSRLRNDRIVGVCPA